jgi:hypothetical protein
VDAAGRPSHGEAAGLATRRLGPWPTRFSRPAYAVGAGADPEHAAAAAVSFLVTLPADRFPNLVPLAPRFLEASDDHRFEYGLERLLDALEVELARLTGPGASPASR